MKAFRTIQGDVFELFGLGDDRGPEYFRTEVYDQLDRGLKEKMIARLKFLADTVPPIMNDRISEKLKDNLFELKISRGNDNIRLFFFYFKKHIVITHGFLKKTRRTPQREIERAEHLRDRFIRS